MDDQVGVFSYDFSRLSIDFDYQSEAVYGDCALEFANGVTIIIRFETIKN